MTDWTHLDAIIWALIFGGIAWVVAAFLGREVRKP